MRHVQATHESKLDYNTYQNYSNIKFQLGRKRLCTFFEAYIAISLSEYVHSIFDIPPHTKFSDDSKEQFYCKKKTLHAGKELAQFRNRVGAGAESELKCRLENYSELYIYLE